MVQGQFGCALDAIHSGRLLRHFNKLAAVRRHQQAIVRLQMPSDLTEWCDFIGGVEEQEPSQVGMWQRGNERGIRDAIRQFDSEDHVIESANVSRHLGCD